MTVTMSFRILSITWPLFGLSTFSQMEFNTGRNYYSHEPDDLITCPPDVVLHEHHGNFEFPRTPATFQGTKAYAPCPYDKMDSGATRFTETSTGGDIEEDGRRKDGGTRNCFKREESTGRLFAVWDGFRSKGCRSKGMHLAIAAVEESTMGPITLENVEHLLGLVEEVARYAPFDYCSATTLVNTIAQALLAVDLFPAQLSLPIRQELFDHLHNYTRKVKLAPGQKVTILSTHVLVETLLFPEHPGNYSYTVDSFEIPDEAVRMAQASDTIKYPRLEIKGYSNDLFGNWDPTVNFLNELTPLTPIQIKWRVYDVQFSGVTIANLTRPIVYSLPAIDLEGYQWCCVYWNEYLGNWSSNDMKTIRMNGSIRCETSHLTAFSVILHPLPKERGGNVTTIHEQILALMSSVGSTLSILGLILTLLTYSIIRSLRKERSNQILLQLALSLLFLHVMSLCSNPNMWHGDCSVPSSLIHYFLLASLIWMGLDAVFMYRILITVFVPTENRFLIKRLAVAWGTPLLLVLLTASIDHRVYSEGVNDLCVIAADLNLVLYYFTYFGPSALILLGNTVIFGCILTVLYQQNRRKQQEFDLQPDKGQRPGMLSPIQVKGALTLFVIFGIGWTLSLGAVGEAELVMRYAHTLLNSGQGLLLFVLRVVMDRKVIRLVHRSVWTESDTMGTFGTCPSGDGRGDKRTRTSLSVTHTTVDDGKF